MRIHTVLVVSVTVWVQCNLLFYILLCGRGWIRMEGVLSQTYFVAGGGLGWRESFHRHTLWQGVD